jgi:hypothetical protein
MGKNSRAVALSASEFQYFGFSGNVPVLQEHQTVQSLGVLDAEVSGVV